MPKRKLTKKFIKEFKAFLESQKYANIVQDKQAFFYLIDKEKGLNSFKAVSKIRKLLDIRKVGFSGTLDPLASGLLIVATSKATKLLDYFHYLPKVYTAKITFGKVSDTFDFEGDVKDVEHRQFTKKELEKVLKKFVGKQSQTVPLFSAKKVAGKKLYEYARKEKKVRLPKTKIEIYDIQLLRFDYPSCEIEVSCSAGTYIRSLANDIGKKIKSGAVLADLRRTAIGEFEVKKAASLDKLDMKLLDSAKLSVEDVIESLGQCYDQ